MQTFPSSLISSSTFPMLIHEEMLHVLKYRRLEKGCPATRGGNLRFMDLPCWNKYLVPLGILPGVWELCPGNIMGWGSKGSWLQGVGRLQQKNFLILWRSILALSIPTFWCHGTGDGRMELQRYQALSWMENCFHYYCSGFIYYLVSLIDCSFPIKFLLYSLILASRDCLPWDYKLLG